MKLHLSLAAALLATTVLVAQNPGSTTRPADTGKSDKAHALEGTWTVLSAEKDGQPMQDAAKDITCTVKDNVVTCTCPKSGTTIRMECTGPGKAKVTMTEGKDTKGDAKEAVYVLTNDYLAVCVHDAKTASTGTDGFQPSSKSHCSIILKRADHK